MKWKSNKEKNEWTSDKLRIRQAEGVKIEGVRKLIYHCYDDQAYVAQRATLEEAKAWFAE